MLFLFSGLDSDDQTHESVFTQLPFNTDKMNQ